MANNKTYIFPNENLSNVSHSFVVNNNELGLLKIRNLPDCTSLLLESFFGEDCDFEWIPVIWCNGEQEVICYPTNHAIVAVPGKYRLVLVDEFGEHITDPTLYEDVQIQHQNIYQMHNISEYYGLCCPCC